MSVVNGYPMTYGDYLDNTGVEFELINDKGEETAMPIIVKAIERVHKLISYRSMVTGVRHLAVDTLNEEL